MSYLLRKSLRKRGLYLQIYESHYPKEQKKTVTRFVATLGYYEDIKRTHRDPVEHGLSLVRSLNDALPKRNVGKPRRADIDRTLFVQILKPFELLHQSLGGGNALPLFQERLSRIGDIAIQEDDAGRGMRRVLPHPELPFRECKERHYRSIEREKNYG